MHHSDTQSNHISLRPANRSRHMAALLGLAAVIGLSGCATLTTQPGTPEEQVSQRSLDRDQAYRDDDYEAIYSYFTPGYRQTHSFAQFQGRAPFSITLKDSEILDVQCDQPERCEVKKRWVYQLNTPMGKQVGDVDKVQHETWIQVDGQWYYYRD